MELRKKVLILGQIPKEYGGSYTTGVGNVIINYLNEFSDTHWSPVMFATNLRSNCIIGKSNFTAYGVTSSFLLRGFVRWVFLWPNVRLKMKYYISKGVSWKKGFVYEWILIEIVRRERPSVIHVHNSGLYPAIKALNLKKPIILTFHGIFSSDAHSVSENMARGIDLKKLMNGIVMDLPDMVTVLTKAMRVQAVQELGIPNDIIKVISNGVSCNFFYDFKAGLTLRKEMSIDSNEYLFISVGALTKRKNHITAIEFLCKSQLKFTYIIIGRGGDYSSQVQQAVAEEPRVRLIEYVDNSELYRYYSAADTFILPSTKEGQALVSIEALACGLPLVVNQNVLDSLDFPKNYNDVIYPVNLDKSIESILFKKLEISQREDLSKRVMSDFSWKQVKKKYLALYDSMLA